MACSMGEGDSPAEARRKIKLLLLEACNRLPDDMRVAALVALGLHEGAQDEFLDRRVDWLANYLDRDPRTARRRIDQAFSHLAEGIELAWRAPSRGVGKEFTSDGWYVESMRATLRLDADPPQLLESRRIVATSDDLGEVVVSLSVPRAAAVDARYQVDAEVIHGGELTSREQVSPGHSRLIMRLPRPLGRGEHHDYGIQFTSYPREVMRPYYVVTPFQRFDHALLRVRYDRTNMPKLVWCAKGVPAQVIQDSSPSSDILSPDSIGEVVAEFHSLQRGLSYGIQWQ